MEVIRAGHVGELREALAAARASERPTCVYVETDPDPESGARPQAWWDVLSPRLERPAARRAREQYERQRAQQRRHL